MAGVAAAEAEREAAGTHRIHLADEVVFGCKPAVRRRTPPDGRTVLHEVLAQIAMVEFLGVLVHVGLDEGVRQVALAAIHHALHEDDFGLDVILDVVGPAVVAEDVAAGRGVEQNRVLAAKVARDAFDVVAQLLGVVPDAQVQLLVGIILGYDLLLVLFVGFVRGHPLILVLEDAVVEVVQSLDEQRAVEVAAEDVLYFLDLLQQPILNVVTLEVAHSGLGVGVLLGDDIVVVLRVVAVVVVVVVLAPV